ncbi:hypothetical protein FTX61_01020 [Nitriliruptoraceae bacterium ZYF776]|nr:hypothetical protein [Profundirhabdus halotolerans]
MAREHAAVSSWSTGCASPRGLMPGGAIFAWVHRDNYRRRHSTIWMIPPAVYRHLQPSLDHPT